LRSGANCESLAGLPIVAATQDLPIKRSPLHRNAPRFLDQAAQFRDRQLLGRTSLSDALVSGGETLALTFPPDHQALASSNRNGTVYLWDRSTWRERRRLAQARCGRIDRMAQFNLCNLLRADTPRAIRLLALCASD
jgi:hypothetical protein